MNVLKKPAEFFRWFFFLSYAVFLFVICTLPVYRIPVIIFYANDKILHFFGFLLLTLLGFKAARTEWKIIAFSFLYGALIEWVQRFVPGRYGSLSDFLADGTGTVMAFLIFRQSVAWQK